MQAVSTKYITLIILFLTFLFPSICSEGIRLGIDILFNSFIPAILPLLLYSNYLLISNSSYIICDIIHPIFHKLFKTSKKGSYALLMGFLCGYPLGTKILCDLIKKNEISCEESTYLFKFINNPGPAFIQGYVFSLFNISFFERLILMFCTYIPSIIIGIILSSKQNEFFSPIFNNQIVYPLSKIIDDSISNAFSTILRISGYLLIFSVLSTFIQKVPFLPDLYKVLILCFVEITSGINFLSSINLPNSLGILLAISFSILGGMSIFFQIRSVSINTTLRISDYIKYKLFSVFIFILLYLYIHSILFFL